VDRSSPPPLVFVGCDRRAALGVLLAAAASGCGYIVGNPYPANIRTVHVPTFTNSSFRRGYELMLTEAVHREIMDRTPFRLVGPADADTRLIGHIKSIDKNLTNQNRWDDPRELELRFTIEVRWENARTGELLDQRQIPVAPAVAHVLATSSFTPETGQSLATATQQAIDQIARQVVQLMEMTW
jgi:hypothetical protein